MGAAEELRSTPDTRYHSCTLRHLPCLPVYYRKFAGNTRRIECWTLLLLALFAPRIALWFPDHAWTTPPDVSDEDSVATVRISHIGMHWNRDLVQSYAFPNFADILRCFVSQEQDCPSAVRPPPHCIIRLIHIQKVVTKGQDLWLQIYIVFGLPWLKSL